MRLLLSLFLMLQGVATVPDPTLVPSIVFKNVTQSQTFSFTAPTDASSNTTLYNCFSDLKAVASTAPLFTQYKSLSSPAIPRPHHQPHSGPSGGECQWDEHRHFPEGRGGHHGDDSGLTHGVSRHRRKLWCPGCNRRCISEMKRLVRHYYNQCKGLAGGKALPR